MAAHVALLHPAGPGLPAAQRLDRVRLAAGAVRHRAVARAREDARRGRDHLRRRPRRAAQRARPRGGRARRGRVPVPRGRRGHPHGDRAAADRDRRPGRRQAAHRPLAQRPGRHRRGDVHARARAGDDRAPAGAAERAGRSSPTATSTGRCPATRTSSARSPSTSPTTCSPTSGCSGATRGGSSSCSARRPSCRWARARWPA